MAEGDQYTKAVSTAIQQYPWLGKLGAPIALTTGTGPYQSESYMPTADENPIQGHYTVQLRSNKMKMSPQVWPDLIGSEGLDWLARQDPTYQKIAQMFLGSMSKDQIQNSWNRYQREIKENKETRNFPDFMKGAEIQEYIRGYMFPKAAPGWTGPKGEGRYTPQQEDLMAYLKAYLDEMK